MWAENTWEGMDSGVGGTVFAPWYEVLTESPSGVVFFDQPMGRVLVGTESVSVSVESGSITVGGESDELHIVGDFS